MLSDVLYFLLIIRLMYTIPPAKKYLQATLRGEGRRGVFWVIMHTTLGGGGEGVLHLQGSSIWKCQVDYNEKDGRIYILPECIVAIKQERLNIIC